MNSLFIASFIAGALTILAPCIFAALPLILGRSAEGLAQAWRVIFGLLASIFVFTLLLKGTTLLIGIPSTLWQVVSGVVVSFVGLSYLFPQLYAHFAILTGIESGASKSQRKALNNNSPFRDYLLGISLGPVFSACSPTYALIVAVILPVNFAEGVWYLLVFLAGLGLAMSVVAIGGQRLVNKLNWSLDPSGWFKRGLGLIILVIGVLIATGLDKDFLSFFVDQGWFDWQINLENSIN